MSCELRLRRGCGLGVDLWRVHLNGRISGGWWMVRFDEVEMDNVL